MNTENPEKPETISQNDNLADSGQTVSSTEKKSRPPGVGRNGLKPPRPWKKGQSGNPAGRKKGSLNMISYLIEALREGNDRSARAIMRKMIARAQTAGIAGQRATEAILDRVVGPIATRVANADGSNLETACPLREFTLSDLQAFRATAQKQGEKDD